MPMYQAETKEKDERVDWLIKKLLDFGSHPRFLNKSAMGRKLGVTHTTICEDVQIAKNRIRENYDINDLDGVSEDFKDWLKE